VNTSVEIEADVDTDGLDVLQTLDSRFQGMRGIQPAQLSKQKHQYISFESNRSTTHTLNRIHLDGREALSLTSFRLFQHIAWTVASNPAVDIGPFSPDWGLEG
jgi:hypothetical protein